MNRNTEVLLTTNNKNKKYIKKQFPVTHNQLLNNKVRLEKLLFKK